MFMYLGIFVCCKPSIRGKYYSDEANATDDHLRPNLRVAGISDGTKDNHAGTEDIRCVD